MYTPAADDEKCVITPLYVGKNQCTKIVNILYYTLDQRSHYAYIKNISQLIYNSTKSQQEVRLSLLCLHILQLAGGPNQPLGQEAPLHREWIHLWKVPQCVPHTRSKGVSWWNLHGQGKQTTCCWIPTLWQAHLLGGTWQLHAQQNSYMDGWWQISSVFWWRIADERSQHQDNSQTPTLCLGFDRGDWKERCTLWSDVR